jgi:hypothetical protein
MNLKNLEGSGHGLFEILSQHLPGKTDVHHGTPQSGWPVFGSRFELEIS